MRTETDEPTLCKGPAARPTVLVAEDHAVQRDGLVEYLSVVAPNARVVAVANGVDAVEAAARERPGVVFMDVRMPVMNGIEATRLIKEALPSTKVVILTFLDNAHTRRKAAAAGADAYVVKGDNGSLEKTVMEWVRGRSSKE